MQIIKHPISALLGDKVAGAGGYDIWETKIDFYNAFLGGDVVLGFEGRRADQELVCEHAQRPRVHVTVVSLALAHLGREVVERAAESGASVGGRVHRPSEVRNLNRALLDSIKVSR